MMLVKKTVRSFIAELASDAAAPGGGSASALAGSLGAALAQMVCNLSLDEEKFGTVLPQILEIKEKTALLQEKLLQAVDEDAQAFREVMDCYKLPKSTEQEKTERQQAIQQAMKKAALMPLGVAGDCLETLKLAHQVLPLGNQNAASDAAVAGLMAYAALQGALFNVKINLGFIKDEEFCQETRSLVQEILAEAKQENAAMEAAVAAIFP